MGIRQQQRGVAFPGSPVCLILLEILLLGFACSPVSAQQPPSTLPDAPSVSAQARRNLASSSSNPEALMSGRSRVFPNLAANSTPLTSQEKLVLAARNSVSGLTIIGSAMGAGLNQARNTETGYGQGADGYFKRFGAGMAFSASSNMIGTYAIASALHEDPRFFVQNSASFGEALRYSTSRIFITRMDDGRTGINWAGLLGPLGAAAIANTYLPADSRGVGNTFSHWGTALAITAGTNLLREYWPRITKKMRLPDMDVTQPSTVDSSGREPADPTQSSH